MTTEPLRNVRREKFCQAVAEGKPVAEAHSEAGYAPNPGNARGLLLQSAIKARISELLKAREVFTGETLAAAQEEAMVSKAWILKRLKENVERAMQTVAVLDKEGNAIGEYRYEGAVANKALELLGREIGMFILDRPRDVAEAAFAGAVIVAALGGKTEYIERLQQARKMIADRANGHDEGGR